MTSDKESRSDRDDSREPETVESGSTIGNRGEPSAKTIPNRRPDDERLSANETQSSGTGKASERLQGREDEWPHGHREGNVPPREEGMVPPR